MKIQTLYEFLKKLDRLGITIVIDGYPNNPGIIAEKVKYPDMDVHPSALLTTMYEGGIRFFRWEDGKTVYLKPNEILRRKKILKNKGLFLVKK